MNDRKRLDSAPPTPTTQPGDASVLEGELTPERARWLLRNTTAGGGIRMAFHPPWRVSTFKPDPLGITAEEYAHAKRVWDAFPDGGATLNDAIGAVAIGIPPGARFGIETIPDCEYVATDWPSGGSSVTTREVAIKYVAIYGPREYPWRAATDIEIAESKAEQARIEGLATRNRRWP